MINQNYKNFGIYEICDIHRGENKTYDPGTIYVRLSACDNVVHILEQTTILNGDFAVIVPKFFIPPYYFFAILSREFPKFVSKYVGTNINLQIGSLKYLRINLHDDIKTQYYYQELFLTINRLCAGETAVIGELKNVKKTMLSKMMC